MNIISNYAWRNRAWRRASQENLKDFQVVSRPVKIEENIWENDRSDIFAFSSEFSGLKIKYHHLQFCSEENMHGVEYLWKV